MTYAETIVFRIKTICNARGLSYYKLSEMSGVNLSTIDNIIRGETKNPRIMTLHKIAIALNMTLSEFLDFKEFNEFSFED